MMRLREGEVLRQTKSSETGSSFMFVYLKNLFDRIQNKHSRPVVSTQRTSLGERLHVEHCTIPHMHTCFVESADELPTFVPLSSSSLGGWWENKQADAKQNTQQQTTNYLSPVLWNT